MDSEIQKQDGAHGDGAVRSMKCSAAPPLTEYEEKVFRRFWKRHTPGYHFTAIQLEGDKQLPVIAAGYRMVKKGVLTHWRSCQWGLSDLGKQMAEERQRQNTKAHESRRRMNSTPSSPEANRQPASAAGLRAAPGSSVRSMTYKQS